MKKKIISMLLVLVLSMTLVITCACNNNDNNNDNDKYSDGSWSDLSVRSATGKNGVVASASAQATYAGYQILKQGGNAFDAIVAIGFALGVTEPYASGIGGGGVMTGYVAETGETVFYNFRDFASAQATPELYTDLGVEKIEEAESKYTVAVPTEVAGLLGIEADLGVLGREKVLAPAINYANNGFVVEETLASNFTDKALETPGAECYSPDGFPATAGDTITNPNYGKVLQEISEKGAEGFYTGWVAEAIESATDGFITTDDLLYAMNNYPKTDSGTLNGTYTPYGSSDTYYIYTVNTPSSGGVILLEALNMLEHYAYTNSTSIASLGNNSAEYLHVVGTAVSLAYGDKRKYVADDGYAVTDYTNLSGEEVLAGTQYSNVPKYGLISKAYAADRWDSAYSATSAYIRTSSYDWGGNSVDTNSPSPYNYQSSTKATYISVETDDSGTTTFSACDSQGNIASITKTLNHFWASYIIPEGTGFFLNNNMTPFSLTVGSAHEVAPYKQPVTHVMPTIIMKKVNGEMQPYATIGTPGSMRIPHTVLQIALNLMEFNMDIQTAIENPRFFTYAISQSDFEEILLSIPEYSNLTWSANKNDVKLMQVEYNTGDNAITAETVATLKTLKYAVDTYHYDGNVDLYFGGVQGITFSYDSDGELESMTGGADIRRSGKALAY